MKEWSNELCSFNSMKGLLYSDWYKSIREWKDGNRMSPKAPVEVSLDPIQACQLRCNHCNASRYLLEEKVKRISDEEYESLVRFLAEWGCLAICHGGGGEPSLHTYLPKALTLAKSLGMENSIASNGVTWSDELCSVTVDTCRWLGISVDSATPETYMKGRGVDAFQKTINTISKLAKLANERKQNCDVAYKFLLFEYNQHEIYEACKIAKDIGAHTFHVRPADLSHQGMHDQYKGKATPYNIELIKEQFARCFELEDDNFKTYCIVHKFNPDMTPRRDFSQCYASPCCIQICPDGNCYLCPDSRYDDFYKLGEWRPNPYNILNFWGKENHYNLVFNTGKKHCTTRCTFGVYCKQCEELFIKDNDPLCWKFI